MTTKEQERQAIEKIRKIVEGLGADSYVGTAMAGVLEVAEQNIEFDAAFSLKGQVELAEKEAAELKKTVEQQEQELERLRGQMETERQEAGEARREAEKRRMPDWMHDRILMMSAAEMRRLDIEKSQLAEEMAQAIVDDSMEKEDKKKLVGKYRTNGKDIEEMERFREVFQKKYGEDAMHG